MVKATRYDIVFVSLLEFSYRGCEIINSCYELDTIKSMA
jgi:hypothetical protein